jgi:hypothetical protein
MVRGPVCTLSGPARDCSGLTSRFGVCRSFFGFLRGTRLADGFRHLSQYSGGTVEFVVTNPPYCLAIWRLRVLHSGHLPRRRYNADNQNPREASNNR